MRISDILSPDAVKVPLESTDKQGAIFELVDLLAEHDLVRNAAQLRSAVWEREQQRSTGIGEGLAVPHGRCDSAERLVMAVGLAPEPIEFGAVDRKPVRLLILLASPPDRTSEHIQALGRISRMMSNGTFRESAFAADSAAALYELLVSAETAAR